MAIERRKGKVKRKGYSMMCKHGKQTRRKRKFFSTYHFQLCHDSTMASFRLRKAFRYPEESEGENEREELDEEGRKLNNSGVVVANSLRRARKADQPATHRE